MLFGNSPLINHTQIRVKASYSEIFTVEDSGSRVVLIYLSLLKVWILCNTLWIVDVDVPLENVFQTVCAVFAIVVWNKFVMGKNKITETSNEITPSQTTTKLSFKRWSKIKLSTHFYYAVRILIEITSDLYTVVLVEL